MEKEIVVYIYSGILLSHKEEQNYGICRQMDEIGEYLAKSDKAISKNQRLKDLTDKQMKTHNGEWEEGWNGGRRDFIEGKEG